MDLVFNGCMFNGLMFFLPFLKKVKKVKKVKKGMKKVN